MSAAAADHHADDHHGLSHVASVKVLTATGGTLLVLTLVTVLATKVDFGANINLAIAMAIAVLKATLVILFFMGVKYNTPLTKVVAASGFLWLIILFGITMGDFLTRGWLGIPGR